MEQAKGSYPTMVPGLDGSEVPVAQAYGYSRYVGHLTLIFDDAGKLTKVERQPILLDASVPEDEAIVNYVEKMAALIEERETVVVEAAAPIDGDRANCRAKECEMGVLAAEAMLDRVKD